MAVSTPVEIFCSYAHEDEPWLRKLETHLSLLKRQGLISLWHDRLITAGTDWAHALDQYLETASVILLLVSADFLASDYCVGIEMKRALERQEAGEALVIPILVRSVDWNGAPFAHLHALPTDAQPLTSWQDEDAALADVAAGIRRVIVEELSLLAASAPRSALPAIWNIPYPRNPFFIGREDLLSRLHAQLQRGQPMAVSQHPQAISGLGGIGKTQTAVEYAYRYHQKYEAVLWAQAESREALVSSSVALAALLNLPEQNAQEHTITVQAVKKWLQTHSKWLLILDNADELALARDFLPPALGGHLLLTTRAQAMGGLAERIEVETFSAEQGTLFLLRRAGLLAPNATLLQAAAAARSRSAQITKALGGLPLALDQAGAYLEETGCSLSEYQRLYQQHRAVLLGARLGLVDTHPPVATTWSLSFQKVEEKNPAAADLLRLCAFLQPDAIPEELFLEGGEPLGPHLQTLSTDPLAFHEAIGTLRAYSLLQRSTQEHLLSVHRLVQAVLQDAMSEQERARWRGRVLQGLTAVFPEVKYATWRQCERLMPHVLVCAAETGEQAESPELAALLKKATDYLQNRVQYEQAEQLYQRMLRIQEQVLGPEHPQVVSSLNELATIYRRHQKYEQAEPLHQRALRIGEQALGPEHPEVARALRGLADFYAHQGKYEQAESLFQRAFQVLERTFGPEHPEVIPALGGLADLYAAQGRYEQAEFLYQRTLRIGEQALGPEHLGVGRALRGLADFYAAQGKYEQAGPFYQRLLRIWEQERGPKDLGTLQHLNNLANFYFEQGKYEQAESLYQRSLGILEQEQGPENFITVDGLNGLANLYSAQGKYEQAEPLYQRALRILEQEQGPEELTVIWLLDGLATLYSRQEKYRQAEQLYQRALHIREQRLGPEHPDVAISLTDLAALYSEQSKYEQAEPLYQRVLSIFEQQLGPEHAKTAASLTNLATLYFEQGKYEQAEPLYQRALRIYEQVRGPEHPDVASPLIGLAALYSKQGKYEQAESLYRHALSIREQRLGPEHPDVAISLTDLAALYSEQGKYEQAEPLYQRALSIREQALGPEHPDVAMWLDNLAYLYSQQGKYEQAGPLYQRALRIYEQVRGPEHPDTATCLDNLANLYSQQSKYEQAEPLYHRALHIWEQALGPAHPDTATCLIGLAYLYSKQGKYEQAESLYGRVLTIWEQRVEPEHPNVALDPNYAAAYLARGYVHLHLKKRDSACADFARYAFLQPRDVNAAWMVVYAALGKRRPGGEIAERLEEIAELDPQCYEACTCRGVALGLCGKPQEGLAELERALDLHAEGEDAWFWKGMLDAYLGRSMAAMESIEQALRVGLPPILLTPLFWLEQERPHFYQQYAEPLLKQHELL